MVIRKITNHAILYITRTKLRIRLSVFLGENKLLRNVKCLFPESTPEERLVLLSVETISLTSHNIWIWAEQHLLCK